MPQHAMWYSLRKGVWLARAEDPAGARPLVVPNGHALVETYHPCREEDIHHVLIPGLDHLPDLPELVTI
jgi:hypothetical protein